METISYSKEVKAAKDHRCNFCGDKIWEGETYITSTHKNDGVLYDWKTHKDCSNIATRLKMYDDAEDGLTEDMFQEYIHSCHDDLLIEMIPTMDRNNYSDIIQQLRRVVFKAKLGYVIRHFAKIDKEKESK